MLVTRAHTISTHPFPPSHPFPSSHPFPCPLNAPPHFPVVSVYADYQHFRDLFGAKIDENDSDDGQQQSLNRTINNNNNSNVPNSNNGSTDLKATVTETVTSGVYSSAWVSRAVGPNILEPDAISPEKQTLWLSTYGAHTPLHYDTYGCNLVRQVKGRKRWRLWNPTPSRLTHDPVTNGGSRRYDTISSNSSSSTSSSSSSSLPLESNGHDRSLHLLPVLRIPYEESSVYSTYDPLVVDGARGIGGRRVIRNQEIVSFQQQDMTDNNNNNEDNDEVPPDYDFVLDKGDD